MSKKNSIFEEEEYEETETQPQEETPLGDVVSMTDIGEAVQETSSWDIFEDIGRDLHLKGDKIRYYISKNGERIGTVDHPFSYDQIKKNWGGGVYKVTARSQRLGRIVKSQTEIIAGDEQNRTEEKPMEKSNSLELLTVLQAMQKQNRDEQKAELDRIREESKAEREAAKTEGNTQMMLMMKMMETQSQQQQNLMTTLLTVMAGNKDSGSDKKLDRMFDMMLEMMNNKRSKGEEIDPLQLTRLVQEAEDRGYSRAKELRELAEEEAERLADLRSSGGREEKEESTTSQILKSVAPMFAQLAMPGAAIPAPQVPQMMPQAMPQVNPHAVAIPTKPVAPAKPKAPIPTKIVLKKEPVMDKKTIVAETVIKLIGEDLVANFMSGNYQPEKTADKALEALKPAGIDAPWLYANFTLQDMISVAKAKGMPDKIKLYLEKFHAHIGNKASVGAGKPSENEGDKPSQ